MNDPLIGAREALTQTSAETATPAILLALLEELRTANLIAVAQLVARPARITAAINRPGMTPVNWATDTEGTI